jgi:hypothetical protein
LLDFGATDSFTVVAAARNWNRPATTTRPLVVKQSITSGAGWLLGLQHNGETVRGEFYDGTDTAEGSAPAYALGAVVTAATVLNRTAVTTTTYSNGVAGTSVSSAAIDSLANAVPLRVGQWSAGVNMYPLDFEFTAAAVFRRALTAAEIQQVSSYFLGRVGA